MYLFYGKDNRCSRLILVFFYCCLWKHFQFGKIPVIIIKFRKFKVGTDAIRNLTWDTFILITNSSAPTFGTGAYLPDKLFINAFIVQIKPQKTR